MCYACVNLWLDVGAYLEIVPFVGADHELSFGSVANCDLRLGTLRSRSDSVCPV